MKYIEETEGLFVNVENRKVVGRHKGHHFYTIGQRARLGGHHVPYFVVGKENETNTILVVRNVLLILFSV